MPTLIDTSAWIEFLRGNTGPCVQMVHQTLVAGDALLCGPVEQELLSGASKANIAVLEADLRAVAYIHTERNDHILAGHMCRDLRLKGFTMFPMDCLIAALCLRRKLPLLTLDKDFKAFEGLILVDFRRAKS
jgi:predicted nucleic acid-binding protein